MKENETANGVALPIASHPSAFNSRKVKKTGNENEKVIENESANCVTLPIASHPSALEIEFLEYLESNYTKFDGK